MKREKTVKERVGNIAGWKKNEKLKQYFIPLTARGFSNTTNVVKERFINIILLNRLMTKMENYGIICYVP